MSEWIFIGIYSFVIVSGFVREDVPVTVMTMLATTIRRFARIGAVGFLIYLLYLGRYVDYHDWIMSYVDSYNNGFIDNLFLLMWLSFPVMPIALLNISLSVSTFEATTKPNRHTFIHFLTIGLSVGIVYCAQRFLYALSDKLIAMTLTAKKMDLFIAYNPVPMDYTFLCLGLVGLVIYFVMGIYSQR